MKNLRLIQAICYYCEVTYKDIYIDYNNNCGDDVVYIKDQFVGYVEDFWNTTVLWDNLRKVKWREEVKCN